MENKWDCPLLEGEVTSGECFDIHMVIEDGAPAWTAPEKALSRKDFKEICLSCKHHRYD